MKKVSFEMPYDSVCDILQKDHALGQSHDSAVISANGYRDYTDMPFKEKLRSDECVLYPRDKGSYMSQHVCIDSQG